MLLRKFSEAALNFSVYPHVPPPPPYVYIPLTMNTSRLSVENPLKTREYQWDGRRKLGLFGE